MEGHNEEMQEIMEKMKGLALQGLAVAVKEQIEALEQELDDGTQIAPLSFMAGSVCHSVHGQVPPELAPTIIAAILREIGPALEGMPDPETAFDDLPLYEPKGEET